MSWFCNTICRMQNQNQNQLILFNNHTQEIFNYNKKISGLRQAQMANGFIMVRKSLYQQHQNNCRSSNKKFIDDSFMPCSNSLGNDKQATFQTAKTIIWKRVSELSENSDLIKDRIQPSDIQQGNIGDCYFLAAISALAENQFNILQIFQKKNVKDLIKSPFGLYKVLLNIGGQPEEVIVDDNIPVYEKSLRPVFCRPVNNQFWVVLLQKAWAKVNGSYANIAVGNPHQVLNKFSVAPVFYHNIHQYFYENGIRKNMKETLEFEDKLWEKIFQGHKQNFAMCCSTRSAINIEGLKQAHSYTLLAAYEVAHQNKTHRLLKIRNPWGNTQYKGQFSQYDTIWKQIDHKIQRQIFDRKQNDGIFIIPFEIFLINFQSINICHCREKYNYIFKSFEMNQNKSNFFQLSVQEDGEVYLTFERNYKKDYNSNKYRLNGVSKILLAREVNHSNQINGNSNGQNQKQYEFIDCALETTLADVTVRCKHLTKGGYIVMVENQDTTQEQGFLHTQKKGTISTYSNTTCIITPIPLPKGFLFKYFSNHAICYNHEKKKIGEFQKDWIAKRLLSQSGYGYISVSLHESGKKRIQITINRRLTQQAGFKLILPDNVIFNMNKTNEMIMSFTINPGDFVTFLFKVDFKQSSQRMLFPPQGFQVKKII